MFQSDLDESTIKDRIAKFREQAVKGLSEKECVKAISTIFGNVYSFPTEMRRYPADTTFHRVRIIPEDDTEFPLRTISNLTDAWEPPPSFVKVQGRLNSVNQSILYCCPNDFNLAIDEARARSSKFIAVMVYKSKRPLNVAVIGDFAAAGFPKSDQTRLFYSFLEEEFARVADEGKEGVYSITRAIADTFFNLPEQDAWCYRSVQSPAKFNVAFLPGKPRACLNLSGVLICDLKNSRSEALNVKLVCDFDTSTGEARYHRIGSEEQKRIFPEIN